MSGSKVKNSSTADTFRNTEDADDRLLWSDGMAAGETPMAQEPPTPAAYQPLKRPAAANRGDGLDWHRKATVNLNLTT